MVSEVGSMHNLSLPFFFVATTTAYVHSVGQLTLAMIFMLDNLSSSCWSLAFTDTGTRIVGNWTGLTRFHKFPSEVHLRVFLPP